MNEQEIFDTVVSEMIKQGKKSVDSQGDCAYLSTDEDGNSVRCAVGCLLSHDNAVKAQNLADSSLFGLSLFALLTRATYLPDYMFENERLLTSLQFAHDTYHGVGEFNAHFIDCCKYTANKFNLKLNIPSEYIAGS